MRMEVRDDQGAVAVSASRPAVAAPGTRSRSTRRVALYSGNSNPGPWGGTPERPNGGIFPGPVLYTDSLLVLDARTGRLLWYDQVHAARRSGLRLPGDAGSRDARRSRRRVRRLEGRTGDRVGPRDAPPALDGRRRVHRNDVGPLPRRRVTVCPGLLGGVETPMAYADGRLFVPVVDLCGWGARSTLGARPNSTRPQGAGTPRRARRRDRRGLGATPPVPELRLRHGLERRRLHVHLRRNRLRLSRWRTAAQLWSERCRRV